MVTVDDIFPRALAHPQVNAQTSNHGRRVSAYMGGRTGHWGVTLDREAGGWRVRSVTGLEGLFVGDVIPEVLASTTIQEVLDSARKEVEFIATEQRKADAADGRLTLG